MQLSNKIVLSNKISCQGYSNYIFIPDLIPDFSRLGKENYKARQESFKFWDLLNLKLEVSW